MASALRATLTLTVLAVTFPVIPAAAQEPPAQSPEPVFLRDRGAGVATSMFGTYVRKGEWLVYPFFEYYRDNDFEYAPDELGAIGADDFRGRYRASEGLFFIGYGLTDDLAFEIEVATIRANLEKSPSDTSAVPARISESGLGDVEGQLRWRFRRETERRPELFSYAEVVVPHHGEKPLIGTADWELKGGIGVTRGFSWGTVTGRAAVEFAAASASEFDLGEYAVEYLKRISPAWRLYLGVEGTQDEVALLAEAQWHFSRHAFVRLNNGFGLTSKATDWAPEVGIVFSIPTGRTPALR